MKKLATGILMMIYFLFMTGMIVSHHYCMNELASTDVFITDSKECGKCGMHIDEDNSCCRDEIVVIKSSDTEQRTTTVINPGILSPDAIFSLPSAFISTSFYNYSLDEPVMAHPPPLLTTEDPQVVNCVFRI